MKDINVISLDESDVKYRIDRFPDGEVQFVFTEPLDRKENYRVICRITNAEELFLVLQIGDILDRLAVVWDIYIRYLMGMRMDRVMSFERPFTLRVVGKMISQMGYDQCHVFVPHSSRAQDEIRTCFPHPDELYDIYAIANEVSDAEIVFPDRGAVNRYAPAGQENEAIYFEKERDAETGQIKRFTLKNAKNIVAGEHFLFFDDLCDAGGTFLGELKILEKKYPKAKFDIRVAHIVNEVGLDNLCKNFNKVYTTESYRDWSKVAKKKGYNNLIITEKREDDYEEYPYCHLKNR